MTIEVGGGGGILKPVAFTSGRISTPASGDILTATAGPGQYLRLVYLMCRSSTTEAGITLTIDGIDIFTNGILADTTPVASVNGTTFGVSRATGDTIIPNTSRILQNIPCTSFTVTKVSGTTIQDIDYAYETLEAI